MNNAVAVELLRVKGNLSRAAEELEISSSALREKFETTERFLGGKITDGKRLAPMGVAMSGLWLEVRPSLEKFIRHVEVLKDERLLRLLTIESTWSAEGEWVSQEYFNRVSGGTIESQHGHSLNAIAEAIREGMFDIGIASFPPKNLSLPSPLEYKLWREEDMVVIFPFYKEWSSNRTTLHASEMPRLHQTFFTPPETMAMYGEVMKYLSENKVRFQVRKSCHSIEEIIEEVSLDHGISILPRVAIKKAENNSKIDFFMLNPSFPRPIIVIYRQNPLKPNLQAAFLDVLEKHQKDPKPRDEKFFDSLPDRFPGLKSKPKFQEKLQNSDSSRQT